MLFQAPEKCSVGDEIEIEVTMKNPLPQTLTKCVFEVQGAGMVLEEKVR